MKIKFREFNFKDGNPYTGGPCILEDRSIVWAAMSDDDDGKGGKIAKLLLFPIEVEDRRPKPASSRRNIRTSGSRRM